jgi:dCTP deaminase
MSIILGESLWDLLKNRHLVVTPLLDRTQVQPSSIDVRLGNEFIVIRKTRLSSIDLREGARLARQIHRYQTRTRIEYGKGFVLQPGQLILGATLEYLKLPHNVSAYVIGRSSWGRMGLVIATATAIAPGYHGSPTLEIVNLGEIPISVYPGVRIAQLVFHKGEGEGAYQGGFNYSTGPGFSNAFTDPELEFWCGPALTEV